MDLFGLGQGLMVGCFGYGNELPVRKIWEHFLKKLM
jgi:hypothetical protein